MEKTVRALNMLSAVIILVAGMYIKITFGPVLSVGMQGLTGVVVWAYFFIQIDQCLRGERNCKEGICR